MKTVSCCQHLGPYGFVAWTETGTGKKRTISLLMVKYAP